MKIDPDGKIDIVCNDIGPPEQITLLLGSPNFGITSKRIESCRELGHLASKAVVENPRPLSPIETVPVQHCCCDHRFSCVYQRRAGRRGFARGRRRAGQRQPMVRASGGIFLWRLNAVGRVQLVRLSGPALF
jgi:hypothetical protein